MSPQGSIVTPIEPSDQRERHPLNSERGKSLLFSLDNKGWKSSVAESPPLCPLAKNPADKRLRSMWNIRVF
jgi:hypothetical protein